MTGHLSSPYSADLRFLTMKLSNGVKVIHNAVTTRRSLIYLQCGRKFSHNAVICSYIYSQRCNLVVDLLATVL